MREFVPAIAIVLIAASLSPFALSKAGFFPDRIFFYFFFPLFAIWVAYKGKLRLDDPVLVILYLQIITLSWLALYHGDISETFTAATLFSVAIIYLVLRNGLVSLEALVRAYVLFILVVLALAIVSAVLARWGRVEPVALFERGEGGTPVYLVGLTLTNEVYRWGEGWFIRPSGVFIEPGQLGMHVTLAILANAVVLRSRRYERLLMIFGLITTSVGFYFSLFIFMLLWRRKSEIAASLAVLTVVLLVMGIDALTEDQILRPTVGRIYLVFSGGFVGGNRAADTMQGLELLAQSGLWGLEPGRLAEVGDVDATFVGPLLANGMLGGGILYLHLIFLGVVGLVYGRRVNVRWSENDLLKVFVLLAVNVYHRPFVVHFLYYLLMLTIYLNERRKWATGS